MILKVENLSHIYNQNSPGEVRALTDVNLTFDSKDFVGIVGHTGSGKSTLVQHLNGLIKPTSGRVLIDGVDIGKDTDHSRKARQKIGLVFQYPEHQLFEETIYKDIAFGPKNQGLTKEEVEKRVYEAMDKVGLDKDLEDKSPFELSGGQRRRVAIAGVIAMEPDFLILDEPTAGLDPQGREEILSYVDRLNKSGTGIIFISHSMEDMASHASRLVVMDHGRVYKTGSVREIFALGDELEDLGLDQPQITRLMTMLGKKYPDIKKDILTVEEARKEVERVLGGKNA